MSTYLYLRCVTHDPYIQSDEIGHNLSWLEAIQGRYANREELIQAHVVAEFGVNWGDWRIGNQVAFMAEHPRCELELWDEYGHPHPLIPDEPIVDPTLIHGLDAWNDTTGCANVFQKPFLMTLDNDQITCPECRDKLIRKE